MEEMNNNTVSIDFTKIIKTLWLHRKIYCRVLPSVLVLTYLCMCCLPRYYNCEVSLAPESTSMSLGSLTSAAASLGIVALPKSNPTDAIFSF